MNKASAASVEFDRLRALWAALKIEAGTNVRRRGNSAYKAIKQEFYMGGSRQEVLAGFTNILLSTGVLKQEVPRVRRARSGSVQLKAMTGFED